MPQVSTHFFEVKINHTLETQLLTSPNGLEPAQTPFLQVPSPEHGVPSRKFCCILKHTSCPSSGDAQVIWQLILSQERVSLILEYRPMTVWHCWSRDVHCPLAHFKPPPQPVPNYGLANIHLGWNVGGLPSLVMMSAGQVDPFPGHFSCGSHKPLLSRQTTLAAANWH